MIRLRPSGVDEILIKRVQDWYEPGPGVFITSTSTLFSPAMLFTGSTTGAWYDPSDMTTLFQDAAGTTPVTAVEQPVGLMLDKSGRGNHAFNSSGNSANFPVLSARYNLLTKTEDFSNAAWSKANVTVTANTAIAPNELQTADTLIPNTTNTFHYVSGQTISVVSGTAYTSSVYAKAKEIAKLYITCSVNLGIATFDLVAQTATVIEGSSASITPVGNGWFKCSVTRTAPGNTIESMWILPWNAAGTAVYFAGNGTDGIYIWGADLRVANDALNQPAYQRVNTSSDYDTVGFKSYLKFNGTNQWLQTNPIDFTATDKMFVSAGVRKLSDAAAGIIAELSNDFAAKPGSFVCSAADNAKAYIYLNRGNAAPSYAQSGFISGAPAPDTAVLVSTGNISGDLSTMQRNGVAGTNGTADQGAGNYGNYPLYIGARAGTSLYFNGRLHQLIVAGKQASASEIGQTEAFINQKTGAY